MKNTKKKTPNSKTPNAINIEKEYVVEKIQGKRFFQGETQYFVKWKGFGPESSTWEPMQNLGNCIHLLAKYENDVYYNSCSKPEEQKPIQTYDWNQKCVQLSESSADETSPAFEPVTPPKNHSALSATSSSSISSSSSSSSSTSTSGSSATSSQSSSSLSRPQPQPDPVLPTKQTKPPPQPDLPTNKKKVKFGDILDAAKKHKEDAERKLSTTTEKTHLNSSLEGNEDCSTSEDEEDEQDEISGLELGLKLERVIHKFQVRDDLYLVVRWIGRDVPDMVHIDEIKDLYSHEINQYFQTIQRINDDLVKLGSSNGNNNKKKMRQVQGRRS
ncbi:chromobox protein homolog 2 [Drosophila pseudoobscura]|uniref:Chromobox protein homolog 2 n=1 Tax=Drosophila pseudoobscura pseudoobscura TaxID=46245 RepID=A0A6I8UUQ2_DROPS|nr:chromobox protein homolog 2 [Drosophila pseudoobscura]